MEEKETKQNLDIVYEEVLILYPIGREGDWGLQPELRNPIFAPTLENILPA